MKNEFFPSPKERREIDKRQQEIAAELEPLETEARIRAVLIKKKLQAETDEFDPRLLTQLSTIKSKLYLRDEKAAVDFLALGYEIDTDLEHGSGVGELTIGIKEQLFDIAEEALRQDFPEVDRDQVNLVIGRTIDLYTSGKYFIDVFIEAMEERKKIMSEYR